MQASKFNLLEQKLQSHGSGSNFGESRLSVPEPDELPPLKMSMPPKKKHHLQSTIDLSFPEPARGTLRNSGSVA